MAGTDTLRLMTWNVNSLVCKSLCDTICLETLLCAVHARSAALSVSLQAPTVRNMELKHKSFKGFFEAFSVDIACFQVLHRPPA